MKFNFLKDQKGNDMLPITHADGVICGTGADYEKNTLTKVLNNTEDEINDIKEDIQEIIEKGVPEEKIKESIEEYLDTHKDELATKDDINTINRNVSSHTENGNIHVTNADKEKWNAKADTTDIPTNLSDLTDDSTHRTVTDEQIAAWDNGGDVKSSQGRNLIPFPYYNDSLTFHGVTWTVNSDGSVTANGTATGGNASFVIIVNDSPMQLKKGKTYSFTGCPEGGSNTTYEVHVNKCNASGGYIDSYGRDRGNGCTFTPSTDEEGVALYLYIYDGTTANNLVFYPMLEEGAIAHAYEPTTESNVTLKKEISESTVFITKAEYDALPDSKLTDGKHYYLTDVDASPRHASDITYNDGNVEDALDSLNNKMLPKTGGTITGDIVLNNGTNDTPQITLETTDGTNINNDICEYELRWFGQFRNGGLEFPLVIDLNSKKAKIYGNLVPTITPFSINITNNNFTSYGNGNAFFKLGNYVIMQGFLRIVNSITISTSDTILGTCPYIPYYGSTATTSRGVAYLEDGTPVKFDVQADGKVVIATFSGSKTYSGYIRIASLMFETK